jgi:hypothetical protein
MLSILRIKTDAAIRERYGPKPNPYAEHPQTFACQQIEAGNAMRELMVLVLLDVARALRRLPFCA